MTGGGDNGGGGGAAGDAVGGGEGELLDGVYEVGGAFSSISGAS